MTDGSRFRVFLCHASQDKPVVRELYRRLCREAWIDPWLDEEKLLPGQDWDLEIEKAVESSGAVIVCLSSRSVTKEGYIQKELRKVLDIALEKPEETLFIIPLRLDDCELPRRLRSWHYVDYFPADRHGIFSSGCGRGRFTGNGKLWIVDPPDTDYPERCHYRAVMDGFIAWMDSGFTLLERIVVDQLCNRGSKRFLRKNVSSMRGRLHLRIWSTYQSLL